MKTCLTALCLIVSSFILLGSHVGMSSDLQIDSESYLAKIRSRLLGDWPHITEWEELSLEMKRTNCQSPNCMREYFQKKIRSYMTEKNYISNMNLKVDEMIWLRSAPAPLETMMDPVANNYNYGMKSSPEFQNALNDLTIRVFQENLSWDTLFTAQEYNAYAKSNSGEQRELSFFGETAEPFGMRDNQQPVSLDFTGHPNVSGIFSTPRFLLKFWNSSLNQNRKRAAAIFRITLCDSMVPALERKSQDQEEKAKALGVNPDFFKEMHPQGMRSDRHASDPACLKCHQRLEPMAWTMRGFETKLSKPAFSGRLKYYLPDGKLTNIPAANFSSLIKEVVAQPRYRWCQVDRFMTWIIGNDVHVSEKRRTELENAFDNAGRRTNDFIEYLLMSPEFADGDEGKESISHSVSPNTKKAFEVFKNCNSCHGGAIPNQKGIASVFRALDLNHSGKSRTMPPVESNWQPSNEDIQVVKNWMLDGAPDLLGRKHVAEPMRLFSEAK